MGTDPRVHIIILNWNGWADTLECLESVFRSRYANYRVIVCDNHSSDGSMQLIKAWAEGTLDLHLPADAPLRRLTFPPVGKPIRYLEYDRRTAEQGGAAADGDAPLVLIQTGENSGFAGGNNVGLRYALARGDLDYAWILNNDTVIEPDALAHLVARAGREGRAAICGSTLLYYDSPETVQTLAGGRYYEWIAVSRHIGSGSRFTDFPDEAAVESRLGYVAGTSILIPREFLLDIGLLDESYFIYYEDVDWSIRGRRSYRSCYAARSVVYHKEGATIGSGRSAAVKSMVADFFSLRNRLIITRKFFPRALFTVYCGMLAAMVNRIRKHQWDRLSMIWRIMWQS